MEELLKLKEVVNNAIQKMENDKTKIGNAIEYIKIESSINAFKEIVGYIDSREQLNAMAQADKEKTANTTKKA